MLAVMVAPTVGIDPFTVSYIATLVLVVAISSFGIAEGVVAQPLPRLWCCQP